MAATTRPTQTESASLEAATYNSGSAGSQRVYVGFRPGSDADQAALANDTGETRQT